MSERINPTPDTDVKTGKFFNKNWVKLILSAVCGVIIALFSIILILKSVYAFCWIFLLLFAHFVIMSIIWKKSKVIKIVSVNIAILCILLAGIEALLHHSDEPDIIKEGSYYNKKINVYNIKDRILGFRPEAGRCVTAKKSVKNGEIIFDAMYTIDKNGWRVTPDAGADKPSILFFGGSFTFGEGLNDNENFPWLTGHMTGYRIYNFGFHGYGPHQMLAGIESGIFDKTIRDSKPEYAFYTAIPNHPERSAGWSFWDTYGPEYVMTADNSVQRKGNFHCNVISYILKGLSRSKIYIRLRDACKVQSRQYNVKLAAAIVKQAQKVVSRKYPGIKFQVIYWGKDDDFFQELKKNGLDTIMISQLIPEYFKEKEKYVFIYDGHPNKVATKLVAKGITAKVSGLQETDKRKNRKQ